MSNRIDFVKPFRRGKDGSLLVPTPKFDPKKSVTFYYAKAEYQLQERDPDNKSIPLYTEKELKADWGGEVITYQVEEPVLDSRGEPVVDDAGNPMTQIVDVTGNAFVFFKETSPTITVLPTTLQKYVIAVQKAYINPGSNKQSTNKSSSGKRFQQEENLQIAVPAEAYPTTVRAFCNHLIVNSKGMTLVRHMPVHKGLQSVGANTEYVLTEVELGGDPQLWIEFALEEQKGTLVNAPLMEELIRRAGEAGLFTGDT